MTATKTKRTTSPAEPAKPAGRAGAHRYQTVPLTQPLKWDAWIAHLWENSPSRFFDREERDAWAADYWARNPRLEAQQWRRSGVRAARPSDTQAPAAEVQPGATDAVVDGIVDA